LKKRYILVAVGVASIVLGSLSINSVILAQPGKYDPSLDDDEDGTVDVNDLSAMGQAYGASGDPTKNVNVMNWPTSSAVTVWWSEPVSSGPNLVSDVYTAGGFGQLHTLVQVTGIAGQERLRFNIDGRIWNLDYTTARGIVAYDQYFNTSGYWAIHIPVPTEEFYYSVNADPETTGTITLSFYLTWS